MQHKLATELYILISQLNEIIMDTLKSLGVSADQLVGAMTDSASVNLLGLRFLNLWARKMISIECCSHILQRTGAATEDPDRRISKLREEYRAFFSKSPKRLSEWRNYSKVPNIYDLSHT